jgi:hypothetical protein
MRVVTWGCIYVLDPVRSPYDKPLTGELVVRWVTTGESPLLYVFDVLLLLLYVVVDYPVGVGWEGGV